MRVVTLEPHGFCSGVRAAVEMARHALSVHGEVWCLHELVHNGAVVDELRKNGMRFVERLEEVPEWETVLFSAHGVPPSVRTQAAARRLKVIDATCPFVARAHRQVREFSERGMPVVVVGNAEHVEVIGLVGEYKEFRVSKESKEFKEFKGFKEFKVVKESKVSNDLNDLKDPNDLNDLKSAMGRPILAIGPEGGWTDDEVTRLEAHGFRQMSLGPRILRTDTATIALLARLMPEADAFSNTTKET